MVSKTDEDTTFVELIGIQGKKTYGFLYNKYNYKISAGKGKVQGNYEYIKQENQLLFEILDLGIVMVREGFPEEIS